MTEIAELKRSTRRAIETCEREVAVLNERLGALRVVMAKLSELDSPKTPKPSNKLRSKGTRRSPAGSLTVKVRDAVAEALRQAGRPMKRGELYQRVKASVDLPGAKPERKLSKIMSTEASKQLFTSTGEGYWFKDESVKDSSG